MKTTLNVASALTLVSCQRTVGIGPTVSIELPDTADLFDHVEVHFVLVLRTRRQEIPSWIDEVRGAVEAADVPRRFGADAIAACHEIAVGDGVRRLLEFPEILRQAGDGRRRVEDDLGAIQPEQARALREMTVVADVHADRGDAGLEHRIAEIARLEKVLLPESRGVRNVILAVLPQIAAVAVVDRRGVVIHAGLFPFVD